MKICNQIFAQMDTILQFEKQKGVRMLARFHKLGRGEEGKTQHVQNKSNFAHVLGRIATMSSIYVMNVIYLHKSQIHNIGGPARAIRCLRNNGCWLYVEIGDSWLHLTGANTLEVKWFDMYHSSIRWNVCPKFTLSIRWILLPQIGASTTLVYRPIIQLVRQRRWVGGHRILPRAWTSSCKGPVRCIYAICM